MQRKLEGSRIFTSGVHLGTLWANTDTWSCGMPRVSAGVLSRCALTDIQFQGSCSKLTLYQCYWWVPDSTELMVTKFSRKFKKKKADFFFYFSQIFFVVEYICCISIENTKFWLVWKSVSGNAPKRTKRVSGDNGCYYWKQHLSLFSPPDSHSTIVNFNMCVRFPRIYIKWNSLGKITPRCPYDFMLQPQLRSKANISFWFLLLERCQQNILVLNKCVSVTGIFDGPGCASAPRNHHLLWS